MAANGCVTLTTLSDNIIIYYFISQQSRPIEFESIFENLPKISLQNVFPRRLAEQLIRSPLTRLRCVHKHIHIIQRHTILIVLKWSGQGFLFVNRNASSSLINEETNMCSVPTNRTGLGTVCMACVDTHGNVSTICFRIYNFICRRYFNDLMLFGCKLHFHG